MYRCVQLYIFVNKCIQTVSNIMTKQKKSYKYPLKPVKVEEELHKQIIQIAQNEKRNIQVVANDLLREAIENRILISCKKS